MVIGDFIAEECEPVLAKFLHVYNEINIIHKNTCYKSMIKPSRIDLIIINSPNSFQSMLTFCIRFSDFHKLVVTVLKTSFRKTAAKKIITEIT